MSFVNAVFLERNDNLNHQIDLLSSANSNERREAAESLFILAANTQNRERIAEAGGIGPLVALLSDRDIEARKHAAGALFKLACDIQNHERIQEATRVRVKPLIDLLSDRDTEIRKWVAGIVESMAGNKKWVMASEAIKPLTALLSDGDTGVRAKAAGALGAIAYNPYFQKPITEAGGIRLLVALLPDGDAEVRAKAAAALGSMASNIQNHKRITESRERIAEAGGIRPLLALLSDGDTEVRTQAVGALANLAFNAQNQERIAESGGIHLLLALLSDEDTEVRKRSTEALTNLAENAQNRGRIIEAGGIGPLVTLLSDKDTMVRRSASGILAKYLAVNTQSQERIAEAGGIEVLVALLSDEDTQVRQQASTVLKFASETQNKERIIEIGGIRPLVVSLSDENVFVQRNTTSALLKIFSHSGLVFDDGLLPWLKERFENEKNIQARKVIDVCIKRIKLSSRSPQALQDIQRSIPPAALVPTVVGIRKAEAFQAAWGAAKSGLGEVYDVDAPAQGIESRQTIGLSLQSPQPPQGGVQPPAPSVPPAVMSIIKVEESQVVLGRLLGEGSFGKVYEADYNHQKVAVKKYVGAQIRRSELSAIYGEILLMQQLDQKYLVRLLGIIETAGAPPSLVVEYGEKGSLYAYLGAAEDIPWGWRLRTAEELARGLAYLHGKNIQHRDIKSLNVVLDEDLHAKWCDFGLSLLKDHATATQTHHAQAVGTMRWMAPELFEDEPCETRKNDIWSYGMVLFELATRSMPYKTLKNEQVMRLLMQHKPETVPEACRARVPRFASLMESCWKAWSERPEASELVGVLSEIRSEFIEPRPDSNVPELVSGFIGLSMK